MAINTRLTSKLSLKWPIISAPMANASGGKLAAAVSNAGGLGLIGGGYGDQDFNDKAWQDSGNAHVGIGFITWSLQKQPELLDRALANNPKAIMLSFGYPGRYAKQIHDANVTLICQCQSMLHVAQALDAGAQIIVAQGSEAGGHGAKRATLPFVPEVADFLARQNSKSLLIAAGGIGDGRAIAASLALGADGVLIGTRYWATREALVPEPFQNAAINADGDATFRTSVPDIARGLDWPEGFNIRVLKNRLMREFHPKLSQLSNTEIAALAERYQDAMTRADSEEGGIMVGEVTGLINDLPGAFDLTERLGKETIRAIKRSQKLLI